MRIAAAAGDAEFAMRWSPADGCPASVEQIAQVLQVPADGSREKFEVRYFSLSRTPDTTDGAMVIVRERLAGQAFSEVSANGKDSARQLDAFAQRVVQPLMPHGATPLEQSKTQMGSNC